MNQACADRFEIIHCGEAATREQMKQEVRAGLSCEHKHLPSKYFYDRRGSELFEQICRLPEYYQTRTELAILKSAAPSIMRDLEKGDLIELGSGANWKIRMLLDAARNCRSIRYVPVDVCEPAIEKAAGELLQLYPELEVTGIVSDFNDAVERLQSDRPRLITFFGGTIGNLLPGDDVDFLRNISSGMNKADRLLVGMDLVKDRETLEAAYNDAQGVTAAFNKNVLAVMNRELRANFDVADFDHLAFYRNDNESIEMHLKAKRALSAVIEDANLAIRIGKNETIFTEVSRKFTWEKATKTAAAAGLTIIQWHTDPQKWFAVAEMEKSN